MDSLKVRGDPQLFMSQEEKAEEKELPTFTSHESHPHFTISVLHPSLIIETLNTFSKRKISLQRHLAVMS